MILEVIKHIWNNKISRIIMLTAIFLIVSALIIRVNIEIYNFFFKISKGQVFFDPGTYKKGNYGFTENPEKSEKLFKKGFKKILKLAATTYETEAPDTLFTVDFSHDESWENFTDSRAVEMVYMFLQDLEYFCMPYSIDPSGDTREKLEKRHYVTRKSSKDILQYAIKDDQFVHYANILLEIDQEYFYIGLQKKPDSVPLLYLRRRLLRSVCRPAEISIQMTRAVEYMEYAAEKQAYDKYQGEDSNILYDLTFEDLQKNSLYKSLIKEQYLESYFFTKNTVEKIKKSYNNYILQQNEFYFENYLKNILELSASSGVDQNRKILQTLKQMKTKKNKNNFSYLYTLAEVSFRSRYYEETLEYLNLISLGHQLEGNDYYKVKRLSFLIQLLKTG